MRKHWAAVLTLTAAVAFMPASGKANSADFAGGAAIGSSYAGVNTAPTNGLIVQGPIAIGTSSPAFNSIATVAAPNSTSNATVYGIFESGALSAASTGNLYGTYINPTYSASGTLFGGYGIEVIPQNTSTGTVTSLYGIQSQPQNRVGGTVAGMYALTAVPGNIGAGTVTSMFGLYSQCYNGTGGTVSTCYDLYLDTPSNSGTISTKYGLYQVDSGATNYFAGNVGIGNTAPSHLLHVGNSSASGIVMELQNSSGACTYNPGASSVTVSCSSDRRLKGDIEDTDGALSRIADMRVRDFTVLTTGERRTGVIAQEMMHNHPEMVHENDDGYYSVDEPNPWVLVKALQEQQNEIDDLKRIIKQLSQQK